MITHTIPSSEVLLLTYLVCKLQRQRYKKIQFLWIKSKNFWKKILKIVSNLIIGKVFGLMKIHQDWLVKFFHAFLLGSLSVSRRRLFFVLHYLLPKIKHSDFLQKNKKNLSPTFFNNKIGRIVKRCDLFCCWKLL